MESFASAQARRLKQTTDQASDPTHETRNVINAFLIRAAMDLSREDGSTGLTPSQVLRSLVLMRVKNWDYRELRERIADGYTLRTFTDFRISPCPNMMPSTGPLID